MNVTNALLAYGSNDAAQISNFSPNLPGAYDPVSSSMDPWADPDKGANDLSATSGEVDQEMGCETTNEDLGNDAIGNAKIGNGATGNEEMGGGATRDEDMQDATATSSGPGIGGGKVCLQ